MLGSRERRRHDEVTVKRVCVWGEEGCDGAENSLEEGDEEVDHQNVLNKEVDCL